MPSPRSASGTKVLSAAEAIRAHVSPGSLVFVGGFGQGVPFALAREIIRQGITDLTLCRTGADILFDLLVAAGAAKGIIVGWFGNPGVGISHVCRRALRQGELVVEEGSNFSLLLRLEAAALGVPFLPTRTLKQGDTPAVAGAAEIACPFTGEKLSAVPALTPDVALIHAHRADASGNVQMWGVCGDTVTGAWAARRVVCSVEEVVPGSVIRESPERTVLPSHRVDAIVQAPWGAWPSYMYGLYSRDDQFYRDFDRLSRDAGELERVLDAMRDPATGSSPALRAQLVWRAA